MSRSTEVRSARGLVEARAAAEGVMRIGGYAAKFDKRSQNLGGFVESIDRGFFAKSAGDGWPGVLARYNHDDNWLLGTVAGGTLSLSTDDTGLVYEVDLPSFRADVYELVSRGDVSRSSFAFITFEDDWSMDDNGFPLRTLLAGQLVDVAPVNTPAYLDTSSGLRSLAEQRDMSLDEVAALAAGGRLADLIAKPVQVFDLGARSDAAPSDDSGPEEQGTPTPLSARVQLMRRELELKKAR